jgi:uncharacterized membrane-anchored protein
VNQLAKVLMSLGALLVLAGGVLWLGQRLGLGRLPGDLTWKGKNWTLQFPLATSLLVSLVLTVLLNLWFRRGR